MTSYNIGQVIGAIALAIIIGYFLRTKLPTPQSSGGRALKTVGIAAVLTVVTVVGFATSRPRHHDAQAATPAGPVVHISMPTPAGSGATQAAYVKRANATCAVEQKGFEAAGDGPGDPSAATAANVTKFGPYLRALATAGEHELRSLRALPKPKNLSHYVADTYQAMSNMVTTMRRAAQFADAGDMPRFKQAISTYIRYATSFDVAATAAGLAVCNQ